MKRRIFQDPKAYPRIVLPFIEKGATFHELPAEVISTSGDELHLRTQTLKKGESLHEKVHDARSRSDVHVARRRHVHRPDLKRCDPGHRDPDLKEDDAVSPR